MVRCRSDVTCVITNIRYYYYMGRMSVSLLVFTMISAYVENIQLQLLYKIYSIDTCYYIKVSEFRLGLRISLEFRVR